jgi:hypothetical protein
MISHPLAGNFQQDLDGTLLVLTSPPTPETVSVPPKSFFWRLNNEATIVSVLPSRLAAGHGAAIMLNGRKGIVDRHDLFHARR